MHLDKNMKLKKTFAFLASFVLILVMGAAMVSAAGGGGTTNTGDGGATNPPDGGADNKGLSLTVTLGNPFGRNANLFSVLASIIDNVLLPIGGVLAVMGFIWSGFLYVTAQGKEKQISDAHKAFKYTAIGTIILFGSRAIAEVIANTIRQLG
jgi:hypothetical protein